LGLKRGDLLAKGALLLFAIVLLPLLFTAACRMSGDGAPHWSLARWDSAGLAPDPQAHPEAIIQVYAARAWGWKGIFAVHTWIAFKRENAPSYERYEVVGWGVARGAPAIRRNLRVVDGFWAGSRPWLVGELRGDAAARAIPKIEAAIASYPWPRIYRTWPGPNSNTFIAWILRSVPELGIEMPAEAIGKDYLPPLRPVARTPSGTGYQLSLFGLFGLSLAREEGFELLLFGTTLGIDPRDLAIALPGIGKIGPGARGALPGPAAPLEQPS
jgi:hypothetical protein